MADPPPDPIPGVDLPVWLERLILFVAKQLLARFIPSLFSKETPNGPN